MRPDRPNVVWMTLDSVRADHTSLHGYERRTTPALERLAADGTQFEHCIAHSVATAASTASIVTGTTPSKHQVAMSEAVGTIPTELQTVGELFRAAGYRTACATTNPRIQLVGADAGFDRFWDISRSTLLNPANLVTTVKYLLNIRSHSVGLTAEPNRHSFTYLVNEFARRWTASVADTAEPFFLYLHYNEPHRPYLPPLPFRDRFTADIGLSTAEAEALVMDLHQNAREHIADGLTLSDAEWAAVEAMYDAEIAYTDQQVGAFVDAVRSMDAGETIFVITADHGELLGEYGLYGHQHAVHDALVHVPLVVHGLAELPAQESRLVQHGDVMRTLLSAAGAATDQFDFDDVRDRTRGFAISQEYVRDYTTYEERNAAFDPADRPIGRIDGVRTHRFKLVAADNDTWLYELPDEETDVSARYPAVVERLTDMGEDWLAAHGEPLVEPPVADAYDEATRRRLAELGYLE